MKKLFIFFTIAIFMLCNSVEADKMIPKSVEPVTYAGIKYMAPHPGTYHGIEHPTETKMGDIEVWHIETGEKLWGLNIYTVKYNGSLERDVPDVFITSLKIEDDQLIVLSERGEEFRMEIIASEKEAELAMLSHKASKEKWVVSSAEKYPEAVKKAKEALEEWGRNPDKYEFEGKFYEHEIWVWESENFISVTFYPIGVNRTSLEVEIRMTKEDYKVLSILQGS